MRPPSLRALLGPAMQWPTVSDCNACMTTLGLGYELSVEKRQTNTIPFTFKRNCQRLIWSKSLSPLQCTAHSRPTEHQGTMASVFDNNHVIKLFCLKHCTRAL